MQRIKFIIIALAAVCLAIAIFFVLRHESALLTHPKGIIAKSELEILATNYLLMLIVVVPTIIALFVIGWKYRDNTPKPKHDLEHSPGVLREVILWIVPSIIVAIMIYRTWYATHELDPYRPLKSDVRPLTIQVVAIDWKWLFIYPEQGIASVNFMQFPANTPIHLKLSADGSPMNSFWLPELSGQIYAMTGMTTQLHIMADGPGIYPGRAAEVNGKGLADMTFTAKSTTLAEFEDWVESVKQSPLQLTWKMYQDLKIPSVNVPITLYSMIEEDLFDKIVMKYSPP